MQIRTFISIAVVILATAGPTGAVIAGPKMQVVPHRALYEMSLETAHPRSGVVRVTGALSFQWADSCDGWAVEQRYKLRIGFKNGSEVETRTSYVSWESKDGLSYRFNLRNQHNDVTDEEYRGSAALDSKGEAGKVRYIKPKGRTEPLPAGTVFPTRHTELLIERALAGERIFSRKVFDGTTNHGTMLINAFIGEPLKIVDQTDEPLTNTNGWHMRLAFFPLDKETDSPAYEVSIDLQENGIARSVELDYGDFAIRGALTHLEALPESGC